MGSDSGRLKEEETKKYEANAEILSRSLARKKGGGSTKQPTNEKKGGGEMQSEKHKT